MGHAGVKLMEISIIIPTFNYDKYIARAIRSCIDQSFPNSDFEIIVINDSSKDSTKYILESYGHWIRVVEHKKNMGLHFSRNQGISSARGKYIVNLDADDYLHPDFLKISHLHLTLNKSDAVATDYYLVNDKEEFFKRLNVFSSPIACGILFRKEQMIDVGLYDTSLRIGEDVDFRHRFDKKYTVERIPLPLYRYRIHKKNLTSDLKTNQRYLEIVAEKNNCRIAHNYHPENNCKDIQK